MKTRLIALLCLLPLLISCETPSENLVISGKTTSQTDPKKPDDPQKPDTPDTPETPDLPGISGGYIIVGYAYADSGQLPDPTLPRFSYKKYAVTSSFTM